MILNEHVDLVYEILEVNTRVDLYQSLSLISIINGDNYRDRLKFIF